MNVDAIFRTYDGRHTEPFRDVAAALPRDGAGLALLLAMARDDDDRLRFGATWVLKDWILDDVRLGARDAGRLIGCIGDPAMPPMAAVNLLQAVPRVAIPEKQAERFHGILVRLITDPVPFVRGWAYNALDVLAGQWPDYRDDVAPLLIQAARDPDASVRARMRNRVKERARERRQNKR